MISIDFLNFQDVLVESCGILWNPFSNPLQFDEDDFDDFSLRLVRQVLSMSVQQKLGVRSEPWLESLELDTQHVEILSLDHVDTGCSAETRCFSVSV